MIQNRQLSKNIRLYELLHEAEAMPKESHELIIKNVNSSIVLELEKLAYFLQLIRDEFQKPLIIKAGFRPVEWEKLKGRSGNSQHCLGKAADFDIPGIPLERIHGYCLGRFPTFGIASSQEMLFIHLDTCTEPSRRRWTY